MAHAKEMSMREKIRGEFIHLDGHQRQISIASGIGHNLKIVEHYLINQRAPSATVEISNYCSEIPFF